MMFQILDMSGNVIKVFHGKTAKHEAQQYISKHQCQRLWLRDVSGDTK